jgi:2-furoyl-CoA dehydrogenase large subunit
LSSSADDRINTSLTYGFVFDLCGIEIDPLTYQVRRPLCLDA